MRDYSVLNAPRKQKKIGQLHEDKTENGQQQEPLARIHALLDELVEIAMAEGRIRNEPSRSSGELDVAIARRKIARRDVEFGIDILLAVAKERPAR